MTRLGLAVAGLLVVLPCVRRAEGGTLRCPPDAVKVGTVCIDKYEASVWLIPPSSTSLVKKVQAGRATLADLTRGGATELAPASTCDLSSFPSNFPGNGSWTAVAGSDPPSPGVFAASVAGVRPTACVTWFQAAQACRLSGKRLLTNLEWQDAAAGTPDPGTDNQTTDCAISSTGPVATGSRSSCKSSWGVFDMVGNVNEWVADWTDAHTLDCGSSWIAGDFACFGGDGTGGAPSALIRGGYWNDGQGAGTFAVRGNAAPGQPDEGVGFRCAR